MRMSENRTTEIRRSQGPGVPEIVVQSHWQLQAVLWGLLHVHADVQFLS